RARSPGGTVHARPSRRRARSPWRRRARSAEARARGPSSHLLSETKPEVAKRPSARDVGLAVEVVRGWRRGRVPLKGIGEPGIVADPRARPPAPDGVDEEDEDPDGHDARADRSDQVVRLEEPPAR